MLCILGMGNILLKDDGVGVRVVEALRERPLPPDTRLLEVGTGIVRMLPELLGAQRLIVIDAMRGGGPPGTVYRYLGAEPRPVGRRSVHDIQFEEVLAHLRLLGHAPQVEFYGIEPEDIAFSLELSPRVARQVPLLADHLLGKLVDPEAVHPPP